MQPRSRTPLDLAPSHRNKGIAVSADRVRVALARDPARDAVVARDLPAEIETYRPTRPALPRVARVESADMYPNSLRSPRLELRELTVDDMDAVHAIYGSAEAAEHLSFEPRSRDQVGQIVARSIAAAGKTPRDEYAPAVIERDTAGLIGFARLALDPHQQGATIGFALRPDAWGIGYGVETVRFLLELGFDELELRRIRGARSPHNSASAKTMLTAGMREDYTIREHIEKGRNAGATRWCTRY